jgi:hypothetical protein
MFADFIVPAVGAAALGNTDGADSRSKLNSFKHSRMWFQLAPGRVATLKTPLNQLFRERDGVSGNIQWQHIHPCLSVFCYNSKVMKFGSSHTFTFSRLTAPKELCVRRSMRPGRRHAVQWGNFQARAKNHHSKGRESAGRFPLPLVRSRALREFLLSR